MSDVGVSQTLVIGHLWQSLALAAVLALVLFLGKRMRGSTRYGLGVAAFMASLALPLVAFIPGETIVSGLLQQLNAPVAVASTETTRLEVDASHAATVAPLAPQSPAVMSVSASDGVTVSPVAQPAPGIAPVATSAPTVKLTTGTQPISLATLPELQLPDLGLPLLAIWLGVAAILMLRTGRDLVAVERLVARARLAELPLALQARMKGVRVVVSPEAPGPMAAGLLRPCIVLPESIALGSPGMAGLLEHEHAHIRRRDMLAALGQRIVLALLWWSPALYWISRRIDEEREVACDEAAVDRTGDARAFARSLTSQAENQLWIRAPRLAVGAIGQRSHFSRRVHRLIDIAKTGGSQTRYSGRLAFAGLVLAVGVAAMVTPRFTAEAQQSTRDSQATTPAQDEARTRTIVSLGGRSDQDTARFDLSWADGGFEALGGELEALMAEIGPELQTVLAELTPELQAEMSALGVEMSALGIDLAGMVGQEVMAEMPTIVDEVRRALGEADIGSHMSIEWQKLSDAEKEEVRAAFAEAREELRNAAGSEMRAEIRAAMDEARFELANSRAEIAVAMANGRDEARMGLDIARQALAAAREEMAAARERGDFRGHAFDGEAFGANIELAVMESLRAAGIPVDGHETPPRPLDPPKPVQPPKPPAPLQ